MEEKNAKKNIKIEIIIIAALLLVALLWVALSLVFRQTGGSVTVEVDGVLVAEYSLSINGEYSIFDGGNILIIEDGCAYMKEADCPDKTCVGVGRIKYAGQSIICLPNRVVVSVVGEGELDLVS